MKRIMLNTIKLIIISLNSGIGYCLPMYFTLLFLYITNNPKGFSYYISDDEYIISLIMAALMIFIFIIVEIVANFFVFKLNRYNKKILFLIIVAFTFCGSATYFIINGVGPILRAIK